MICERVFRLLNLLCCTPLWKCTVDVKETSWHNALLSNCCTNTAPTTGHGNYLELLENFTHHQTLRWICLQLKGELELNFMI